MLKLAKLALRAGDPLLPLGQHVPFLLQRVVLERVMAHLFAQPLKEGEFDVLQGRWLRLEVLDLGLAWCVTRDLRGLRLAKQAPVDVCIKGNWREFLLLASRQEDPDTLFFRRRLVIEGDTDLGLAVKNLMDSLDPDQLPPRLWQLLTLLGAGRPRRGNGTACQTIQPGPQAKGWLKRRRQQRWGQPTFVSWLKELHHDGCSGLVDTKAAAFAWLAQHQHAVHFFPIA